MISPHDRIRGASDVPMTAQGHQQVAELGQHFAHNGPLDIVISSDMQRTRDTAHAISNGAPVILTPHLRDMDYGKFTGMATRDAISPINKAIVRTPDAPVDGATGESFNHYRTRLEGVAKLAIHASNQYPNARIGMVVNRRSIKTLESWLDNGHTDDKHNIAQAIEADGGLKPGDIFKLSGHGEGQYKISKADATQPMEPGIYLIRHGMTPWNGESYKEGNSPALPQQASQPTTNPI